MIVNLAYVISMKRVFLYMKTMIVSLTETYIVLVNAARYCRNLVLLLYAQIPVLFCADRLPCPIFCSHQSLFYGHESKHVLLC